jgi:glycogen debranching enzyme
LGRHLEGGLHEDIDITHYGNKRVELILSIAMEGDFADIFEVKSDRVVTRGAITTNWDGEYLTTRYRNQDFSRAFRVHAQTACSPMHFANGCLSFIIELEPAESWHGCLLYDLGDGEEWHAAPSACVKAFEEGTARAHRRAWRSRVVKIQTSHEFERCFARALDDMAALRLPMQESDDVKFVPAAGLPWFAALFGRDSLVISLQSEIVHPEFAQATLATLAKWQARERDDYRDAEPGKIHHELRRGELAHFGLIPHSPYYGSADATPLYLITLHSAFMASGDLELLERHRETAERCLDWIDRYGDRDGDGFQEYQTRSSKGYENQGWKDSSEALVDEDGNRVKGPKATCELQGYVYDAWLRMAQLYDYLEEEARANELRAKARALFERFNLAFWNDKEGAYAFALDGDKRQIRSVASNPGHCLWSGIVPQSRARKVADRLMRPDMWNGWGIRSLSAAHVSFNPYHYQLGAVWPHDNGLIAQGMKRYGFHEEAARIAQGITDASGFFEEGQLPELFAGLRWGEGALPVRYLGANAPQGWAAGSVFSLLQALLGFQPDAPNDRLFIDPELPEWMGDLTVRDLCVGKRMFDIRFCRQESQTRFEILKGQASRVHRRPMMQWAQALQGTVLAG